MSQTVWRIAADTKEYAADDLTGKGAAITGGRWNQKGTAMVYASTSRALACLETFVHLNADGLPLNRYLVAIEIDDRLWSAAQVENAQTLPIGWDAAPASATSIAFGTAWAKSGSSLRGQVTESRSSFRCALRRSASLDSSALTATIHLIVREPITSIVEAPEANVARSADTICYSAFGGSVPHGRPWTISHQTERPNRTLLSKKAGLR